jgi:F-type H+-transporting ATPase subunit delta
VTGHLVARKYARGLFAAGRAQEVLDALYDEAESLLAYLRQERGLLAFLTAPQIKDQDKEQVVRDTFASRVSATFLSFLLLLVAKHRINHLDDILDQFIGLVKEHRGIVATKVRTAFPLTGTERDRIAAQVAQRTGKQVELTVVEDASLIGGVVVIVGNRVFDYSLRHFLRELKHDLLALKT